MLWLLKSYFWINSKYNHPIYINFIKSLKSLKIKNYVFNNNFGFNYVKKNQSFFLMFKFNNLYFYSYKYLNINLFNNFFKNINYIFFNNKKILFLDSEINYLLPFYNYYYGYKSLFNYKHFFFVNKNYLVKTNWIYYYKIFIKREKITGLVILDYYFFQKFIKVFSSLNIALFSFFSPRFSNTNIDFFFYVSHLNNNVFRFILFNNIISLFFKNFNFNILLNKKKYFNKFNNIKLL